MNESVRTHLPDLDVPHLTGGFFQGIWLKGLKDETTFLEALKAKGVLLAPASVFAPGWKERLCEEKDGAFFRVTFPALTEEENSRGVELIAETYREVV